MKNRIISPWLIIILQTSIETFIRKIYLKKFKANDTTECRLDGIKVPVIVEAK